MLNKAAEKSTEPVERIKCKVTGKDVVNFDETGLRAAGCLHWLHCACSGPWRFYTVQKKRGQEGMEEMGVLPEFTGVAVHDFWSSYKKFKNMFHAMCCQHLERELVYVAEIGNQEWAGELRKLLQEMCHMKNLLADGGRTFFTGQELQQYMEQYDCIVAAGLAANPLPERKPGKRGRLKKGKIRCLLERFQDCKADILRFATDWRVPYTNNAAEQAIRFARVKEKVSGCFRTEKGAERFARVLSFISTAVRHGISSFDACLLLRNGTALALVESWQD
jgi:transposase